MVVLVIAVGYQCPRLNEVLAPWVALKCGIKDDLGQEVRPKSNHKFVISVAGALFKERREMGETYENSQNEALLQSYLNSGAIDALTFEKEKGILDFESRNLALEAARKLEIERPNLIWQLDLFDEYYQIEQIEAILKFIEANSYSDWYAVNFKNFVNTTQTYVKGFCPPRIFWYDRHGGLEKFIWDNDWTWKNGCKTSVASRQEIPEQVALINHESWCGSPEFLKRKVEYQKRAINCCSFKWSEEKNCLEFDTEYFNTIGKAVPQLFTK